MKVVDGYHREDNTTSFEERESKAHAHGVQGEWEEREKEGDRISEEREGNTTSLDEAVDKKSIRRRWRRAAPKRRLTAAEKDDDDGRRENENDDDRCGLDLDWGKEVEVGIDSCKGK